MDKLKNQSLPPPENPPAPQAPAQSPSTPPCSMLCCSKPLLIPILLAGVVLVLGVGYLAGAKFLFPGAPSSSPQITPQPTPTPDPTVNWETYSNKRYGYQLKYPRGLNTEIPENAPQVFVIYISDEDEYLEVEIIGISSLGLEKEIGYDMQRLNPTKTNFQNKPAVLVRPARNIYPGEPSKALIIYLEDKKLKIEVGYYGNGGNEALFDQILSTFKFD